MDGKTGEGDAETDYSAADFKRMLNLRVAVFARRKVDEANLEKEARIIGVFARTRITVHTLQASEEKAQERAAKRRNAKREGDDMEQDEQSDAGRSPEEMERLRERLLRRFEHIDRLLEQKGGDQGDPRRDSGADGPFLAGESDRRTDSSPPGQLEDLALSGRTGRGEDAGGG